MRSIITNCEAVGFKTQLAVCRDEESTQRGLSHSTRRTAYGSQRKITQFEQHQWLSSLSDGYVCRLVSMYNGFLNINDGLHPRIEKKNHAPLSTIVAHHHNRPRGMR